MPDSKHSPDGRSVVTRMLAAARRGAKRLGWWWVRALSLTQRLLIGATVVVAIGIITLGYWTDRTIQDGITQGVAATAAATIDSLAASQLETVSATRPLSAEDAGRLDAAFTVANEASSTRLLQIKLYEPDGTLLYDSADGLVDLEDTTPLVERARAGEIVASVRSVEVAPVGPLAGQTLTVLKVYAPIRRVASAEMLAIAEVYFSAASLTALQSSARTNVWLLVTGIGVGVAMLLYLLVGRTSQRIASQRARLAANLEASRLLAQQNRALHRASEELRITANSANEGLLARVGADLHDGPVQLLTLIILRLTAPKRTGSADPAVEETVALATEALEDLRNVSAGLVLPEIADAELREVLELAVARHEKQTGTRVDSHIEPLPSHVDAAVKVCAYRIVQEGLTNAFRHGGGDDQKVRARYDGQQLVIEITNPRSEAGPADAGPADRSLGLKGMRFRVESLGGKLDVEIGAARVATVVASIPLDGDPPAD